jgi:hypothetical protein
MVNLLTTSFNIKLTKNSSICGMRCFTSLSSDIFMTGEDEEVSQRQLEEDAALYGRRLMPTENEDIDEEMPDAPPQGQSYLDLASLQDLSGPSLSMTELSITKPVTLEMLSERDDISIEEISGEIQKAAQLDTWLTESSSAPNKILDIGQQVQEGRNEELDERE